MSDAPLLDSPEPILLVGGAPVDREALAAIVGRFGAIVAADGGADQLRTRGLTPDLIVGDLDSLADRTDWADVPVHHVAEQDSTDFEKCLTRIRAPVIFALGFTGGRLDHGLAAFSTIAQSGQRVMLLGGGDLCLRLDRSIYLETVPGTRVSLFPMGPARGVRSTGLHWPIDGLEMNPVGRIGTSNEATGPVGIEMAGGPVLLVLPIDALDTVLGAREDWI